MSAVAVTAVFNATWRMTDQDIGDWDEGRHAVSAYEMLQRGDLLVNTYRGGVDYWNLKPPLSFWPIMLSYKILGFSTFALRVPSVIFFLATIACVACFAYRTIGRRAALGASAVLATCYPLIGSHSARTGDPDALFVLLMTVGLLAVLGAPERPRLLLLWTTAFSGAFLTKSWHSGLLIVIGVVFLLVRGRDSDIRLRDHVIALIGLVPILLWAVARFTYDGPDFFTAMVQYDLLSRSEGSLETNSGGPFYYVVRLAYLVPWLLVLLVTIVARFRRRSLGRQRLPRGFWRRSRWIGPALAAAVVIGLFSLASTKLPWYAYPAFPPLALLVGLAMSTVDRGHARALTVMTIAAAALAALAAEAYVIRLIPTHPPTEGAQYALAALHSHPETMGAPVYLDATLASTASDSNERNRAKVGDWPQSLRASALINDQLVPMEGGVHSFERSSSRSLILVENDSPTALAVQHTTHRVTGVGRYSIRARN